MAGPAEFRLLGPVEALVGTELLHIGHAKQRCVLTALLVDVNCVVSIDQLVDRVWADRAPLRAREALYSYVTRLRTALAPTGARIVRQTGGYIVGIDPLTVDLHRFRWYVSRAHDGQGADERLEALEDALRLWRGPAFADLDSPWLNGVRSNLELERIAAELDRNDLALHSGRHTGILTHLISKAGERPLDERLAGQLLQALSRSGRQSDALAHYQLLRSHLAEELGIDPSAAIQRLHQRILTGSASLGLETISDVWTDEAADDASHGLEVDFSRSGPGVERALLHLGRNSQPSPPADQAMPAQLPADVLPFVGREEELLIMDSFLPHSTESVDQDRAPTSTTVAAVFGTAGVGKTALAVRWARRAAPCYPEGQLYVDLRGYDLVGSVTAADALAGFLHDLGVAGEEIPSTVDGRSARYRSELNGRRMLILLDNARDSEHVRPLLPGTHTCTVIITSRDSLGGLAALHGAHRVHIDVLPIGDSVALLHRLIGPRVEKEPAAAALLAHECVRLPLALRVAADFVGAQPTTSLTDLVGELADAAHRLEVLDGGDPRASMEIVFSWSYEHLPHDAARMFRMLGLNFGPDIGVHAAASLLCIGLQQARRLLIVLARAHLINRVAVDRYSMHDLLRAYAAARANAECTEDERGTVINRLLDYYARSAATAMTTLEQKGPLDREQMLTAEVRGNSSGATDEYNLALRWLDVERANLVTACAYAASHGRDSQAIRLASVGRHFTTAGHHTDALSVYAHSRRAARASGDRRSEGNILYETGLIHSYRGDYIKADGCYREAMPLFRDVNDPQGEAFVQFGLGVIKWHQGDYLQAAEYYSGSEALCREIGDQVSEAYAANGLGLIHSRQGRLERASECHQKAIKLFQNAGDRRGEAYAQHGRGVILQRQGLLQRARKTFQLAFALFRSVSDRDGEPYAVHGLGLIEAHANEANGFAVLREAINLYQKVGNRAGEAEALNDLGEALLLKAGDPMAARVEHEAARALAVGTGNRYEHARALNGIAAVLYCRGELSSARAQWEHSLCLYQGLDVPEIDGVLIHLAEARQAVARHARRSDKLGL